MKAVGKKVWETQVHHAQRIGVCSPTLSTNECRLNFSSGFGLSGRFLNFRERSKTSKGRLYASFEPPSIRFSEETDETENQTNNVPEESPKSESRYTINEKHRPSFQRNDVPQPTERFYVVWNIYKTKAALSIKPLPPSFQQKGNSHVLVPGTLLIEMASEMATRQYDWENKIVFGLSPVEIGTILASPEKQHDFIHDPTIKTHRVGTITKKTFQVRKAPEAGWFFTIRAFKGSENQTIRISVTDGEFEVFKANCHYLIPLLYGFDKMF